MVYLDDVSVLSCDLGVVSNSGKPARLAYAIVRETTLIRIVYQPNILSGHLKTLSVPFEDLLTNEWMRVEDIGASRKKSWAKFLFKLHGWPSNNGQKPTVR